jgi:hypothetical protein
MELPTNPFAMLTFISAPAVLTNASCVLLFGTGNRYGRAVDRMHELARAIEGETVLSPTEKEAKMSELSACETRAMLIVRGLTCFYTAVAGFVASTLVSLIGAVMASSGITGWVVVSFAVAFAAGAIGVAAMISGAVMLARETTYSFRVLKAERVFLTARLKTE